MFKLISLSVIFIVSSYVGFIYGESFRKRYDQLKEILNSLIILQNDILYGNTPLPEALESLKIKVKEPINKVIEGTRNRLVSGNIESVYDGFSQEFLLLKEDFYLSDSDKRILGDFLKSLGESGVYGQEKIFALAIEGIKINLEEAHEIAKKNIKLYRYLGICFGAMIIIFLV